EPADPGPDSLQHRSGRARQPDPLLRRYLRLRRVPAKSSANRSRLGTARPFSDWSAQHVRSVFLKPVTCQRLRAPAPSRPEQAVDFDNAVGLPRDRANGLSFVIPGGRYGISGGPPEPTTGTARSHAASKQAGSLLPRAWARVLMFDCGPAQ